MSEILKNLNGPQREAVVNYQQPSLIIAGAGSGKTRVLTSRIAYMLEQGVRPWTILALTFTNKAAREMRERIASMVSSQHSDRLWMGTFHSMFLRILRMEADKLGYPSSFTIYDTADSRNLVKTIIKDMNLSDETYKPAAIMARISLAKNNLVTPQAYEANTTYISEDRNRKMPEFSEIYKTYMVRMKENAAMDFDDILLNINILFRDFPAVLDKYRSHFAYILVDEYQDTNYAQYIIIRRLAEGHSRICVVGDDAQSIYSFRGAKVENILRFRNDFPTALTFKLEQNYRSTQVIVNAANSVIEKNKKRLEKESFSEGERGENIKVLKAYTDLEEASVVADEIRNIARDTGAAWSDIAVLYRTNMQSRVFEEAFRRRGIPYRIYGGMSFYQRKEIKDLLAYMQLIVNPKDDEAFKRIINYPARGIGNVTISRIAESAARNGRSLWEESVAGDLAAAGLNAGAAGKVKDFSALIESLSSRLTSSKLYDFGLEVATKTGIIGSFRLEQTPEAQSALDNIEELLNSMQLYSEQVETEIQYDLMTGEPIEGTAAGPSLTEWLQSITLLTDMDKDTEGADDNLTLMTVHSAKGLEFRFVFIVGLEENLFPSQMSMDGTEGLEEERRLFYVALTRAKESAWLSFSQSRIKWGSMTFSRPSRFLTEIDKNYLDIAFDLEEPGDEEGPIERMKKNYGDHNQRAFGNREGIVTGRQADKYRSPNPYTGKADQPKRPETVRPLENPESRFKSVGTRRAADPQTSAGEPAAVNFASAGDYKVGQKVRHNKFGTGVIKEIEQVSGDIKISVDFDQFGNRKLLSKFARLEII